MFIINTNTQSISQRTKYWYNYTDCYYSHVQENNKQKFTKTGMEIHKTKKVNKILTKIKQKLKKHYGKITK